MKYGYARVSTSDQDLTIQIEALKKAGCEIVRSEKISGSSRQGRKELETLLEFIRPGDTLVITRIDRLARSLGDLDDIVSLLKSKDVALVATEQPIDTGSAAGKAFLNMLGVFAQFETELRRERQAEGIEKAKKAGKFKGKPRNKERDAKIIELMNSGMKVSEVAKICGVNRLTVQRLMKRMNT